MNFPKNLLAPRTAVMKIEHKFQMVLDTRGNPVAINCIGHCSRHWVVKRG